MAEITWVIGKDHGKILKVIKGAPMLELFKLICLRNGLFCKAHLAPIVIFSRIHSIPNCHGYWGCQKHWVPFLLQHPGHILDYLAPGCHQNYHLNQWEILRTQIDWWRIDWVGPSFFTCSGGQGLQSCAHNVLSWWPGEGLIYLLLESNWRSNTRKSSCFLL